MRKRIIRYCLGLLIIVFVVVCAFLLWLMRPFERKTDVNRGNIELIAHAGGSIDGYTYTNSKEALLNAIDKGYKYIELDLYMTTDSQLVCLHDKDKFALMTGIHINQIDSDKFLESRFFGKYTPMTLREAIYYWERNPFILVTDKYSNPTELNKLFLKNRHNVYVEVRRFWDYHDVEDNGYHAMLTTPRGIVGMIKYFCCYIYGMRKIQHIVVYKKIEDCFLRLYKRLGSKVSVYTENDIDEAKKLGNRGFDMIYTDSLVLKDLFE